MLIFAIVVTIGPNHNNFFLPNLSAKYPAGVFTHNLAAANALRIEPICAPDRCNSVLAKDGMVGAKIPCPIAHANERPQMERISLLSLRKSEAEAEAETEVVEDEDPAEGTIFDDPDVAVVGGGGRGDGVGIFGDFFFVFRPPVFLSSSSAVEEENKAFSTTPVQSNSSSLFVFVFFADDTTALRNILLLDVNDTNARFVLHLVSNLVSLSKTLLLPQPKTLSLSFSLREECLSSLRANIVRVLKEPRQHTRERERDFDDVSCYRGSSWGKTVQKAKKESNDEKGTQQYQTEREIERENTHTREFILLVFEIFVVHMSFTRHTLLDGRPFRERTERKGRNAYCCSIYIYTYTHTEREKERLKRERERESVKEDGPPADNRERVVCC